MSAPLDITRAPWTVTPPSADRPSRALVTGCDGFVVVSDAPLTRETEANALLIAAAPEALEALERVVSLRLVGKFDAAGDIKIDGEDWMAVFVACRAAIAKATRGQS
jgi:hypothetical protein